MAQASTNPETNYAQFERVDDKLRKPVDAAERKQFASAERLPVSIRNAEHASEIAEYRGFTLWFNTCRDDDGFLYKEWLAWGPYGRLLPVSRFWFEPTQDRFNWLIDHVVMGEGHHGSGPLSDTEIDANIEVTQKLKEMGPGGGFSHKLPKKSTGLRQAVSAALHADNALAVARRDPAATEASINAAERRREKRVADLLNACRNAGVAGCAGLMTGVKS
ncbi:hypothetical protein GRI39_02115 [Altererythrobacter indicus]|uniref:Uncharacterized protein n=1 Tax=Altericroceibacterium indicum TaxID=374177 RepID=A0A845A3L2_9SPHN|nr:hypothetical protein [Altericroceibacterium indicum]MXP24842.1 hypothetical protein [Altericroceibacterium indicum]